jgi:alpha-glucoside transport system substrate-binding protein
VPVKVNLKSMIWYRARTPAPTSVTTWDDLLAFSDSAVRGGATPWCMGLGDGASSGWPATDFIEDILLSRSGPDAYQRWATGELDWTSEEVAGAWHEWGEIASRDDFVHGGREGAVLTDFGDTGRSMFGKVPGCEMEHQASFMMNAYRKSREKGEPKPAPGTDFDFMPFPAFVGPPADSSPVIASADFAAMFNDTPEARRFMNFLATDEAQKIWPGIAGSGAFTVNKRVSAGVYGDDISKRIATTLREARELCLDASDVMPATMRKAFYRAVLDYLDDPTSLPSLLAGLEHVREVIPDDDWLDRLSCDR